MSIVGKIKRWRTLLAAADRLGQWESASRQQLERMKWSLEQVEMLKSSLEVPQALVDDFFQWKATNPIPQQPLVSVCVATFNRASLVTERCLASLMKQSYTNFEVVVVGDCCTDETAEVMGKIKDSRLKFINLPGKPDYPVDPQRRWLVAGTRAMNKALALAEGDYITHLDDDDEHEPERLQKLVDFAVANQCDFVWHPFWQQGPDGGWKLNDSSEFAYTQITTSSVFYRSWFKKIEWNVNAHRLLEPGDWNRFRRMKYIGPKAMRFPEPLLRHYRERQQMGNGK
jgi:glycosyltransferase involved in cell wall biosynthesis